MYVPFFSIDDEITALKKLKVLFVVRRIRYVDFFMLVFFVFSVLLNFVYFILIKGKNDLLNLLNPIFAIFSDKSSTLDFWNSTFGYINVVILFTVVFLRIFFAIPLYSKMKNFENKNPGFKWKYRSKFWLIIYIPFISFFVYPVLVKLTNFEVTHRYNL